MGKIHPFGANFSPNRPCIAFWSTDIFWKLDEQQNRNAFHISLLTIFTQILLIVASQIESIYYHKIASAFQDLRFLIIVWIHVHRQRSALHVTEDVLYCSRYSHKFGWQSHPKLRIFIIIKLLPLSKTWNSW